MAFEVTNFVTLPGGSLMAWGTAPMDIPGGGAHVRQVTLTMKKSLFVDNPTVNVTIVGEGSVGEAFVVNNLTFDRNQQNVFLIKVTATNMEVGVTSNLNYFCHFVLVGKAGGVS